MTHRTGIDQAVGSRSAAGCIAIDSRTAASNAGIVRIRASNFAETSKADGSILLADRKPVAVLVATLVSEVVSSSWIASSDRALLEMTLENVAARKCVFAKVARVWSITSICETLVRYPEANQTRD